MIALLVNYVFLIVFSSFAYSLSAAECETEEALKTRRRMRGAEIQISSVLT